MGFLDQLVGEGTEFSVNSLEEAQIFIGTHGAVAASIVGSASDSLDVADVYRENGTVSIDANLKVSSKLQSKLALINNQINHGGTAAQVFSGGIKRGSTCKLQLTPSKSAVSKGTINTKDSSIKSLLAKDDTYRRGGEFVFDKFSVESWTETDEEKYQIFETMTADFIYAFGRRPRMVTLAGSILNGRYDYTQNGEQFSMDWKNAMQRFYANKLRATSLIEDGFTVLISLQDTVYTGYLLNLINTTTAFNQAVSTVTLIFVISNKYFAGEADDRIPGQFNGKVYVPSKETLDEFLPEPVIEDFMKNEASSVLNEELLRVESEINVLETQLKELIGANDVETGIRGWVALGETERLTTFGEGLLIHPSLINIDSKIRLEAFDYIDRKSVLNNQIASYSKKETFDVAVDVRLAENLSLFLSVQVGGPGFLPPVNTSPAQLLQNAVVARIASLPLGDWTYQLDTDALTVLIDGIKIIREDYDKYATEQAALTQLKNSLTQRLGTVNSLTTRLVAMYRYRIGIEDGLSKVTQTA